MKKLVFVIGLGLGFILGSKAGSGPYEGLEQKVRALRSRPEVDDAIERARGAANQQVTEVVEKVNEKLPQPPKEAAPQGSDHAAAPPTHARHRGVART